MTRPTEFNTEQIIKAGQALLETGRNITGFALRQKIGGGNPARLKQVWEEHASRPGNKPEPLAELPLEVADEVAEIKKEINERINEMALKLNNRAVKTAERRVAETIREANEEKEQANRELADAAQTVEELESRLDEANSIRKTLEGRLAELTAANNAQAVELATLKERLKMTEQHAKEQQENNAKLVTALGAKTEKQPTSKTKQPSKTAKVTKQPPVVLLTDAITTKEQPEDNSDALLEIDGMDKELASRLIKNRILTRDDLAEMVTNDLAEMTGIDAERAKELISRARAHWFPTIPSPA